MEWCIKCANEGLEGAPCPKCGREAKKLDLGKLTPKEVDSFVLATKQTEIPQEYIGIEWSSDQFWRYHRSKVFDSQGEANELLQRFVRNLERIHDYFARGQLPPMGAIITAPSTYSKVVFAYSCMQQAIKHGFQVAPLLDTLELKRLLVLAAENPKYKLYGHIEYDNYIMSDVMFITVTKTPYKKEAFSVIQEVLDRRSRKGLSTFVISEASLEEMSEKDYTGNFMKMTKLGSGAENNGKKYPPVIQYREGYSR